jgi:hypothetical protein
MAHEQLPHVPVIDLPREVAEDLIRDGHAESAPNIHALSAVPDYWQGILLVTGAASSSITIVEALNGRLARRLRRWQAENPAEVGEDDEPRQRLLVFRASKGSGQLNLNAGPTQEQLEAYLMFAYLLLRDDAKERPTG